MNAVELIREQLEKAGTNSSADSTLSMNKLRDLVYAYEYSSEVNKYNAGQQLYKSLNNIGFIASCILLLEELIKIEPKKNFLCRELEINKEKLELLTYYSCLQCSETNHNSAYIKSTNEQFKILHVLNTSMPYLNNGYSIRSKYIIESQKNLGLQPIVVTRPGYPNDLFKDTIKSSEEMFQESINDVLYYRILLDKLMRYTPIKSYVNDFSKVVTSIIDEKNPDIIHAASNYVIGLSALKAARYRRKPFIYEIRGFWELTKVSKEPLYLDSEDYKLAQNIETYLTQQADRVIVISQQLKNELISRQVPNSKIHVIPNGVDCNSFKPVEYNKDLAEKYKTVESFTIGYIGSIVKYEGLQTLLKALALLRDKGHTNIKLIIVGDGDYKSTLEELSHKLKLDEIVCFAGRVPHDEVIKYYSIIDVCVCPRSKELVTKMVTPLKPLEAMACGKALIAADLEALREMIIPYTNGLLFDNTEASLADKIELLMASKEFRIDLGLKARAWVEANRDWKTLSRIFDEVYNELF